MADRTSIIENLQVTAGEASRELNSRGMEHAAGFARTSARVLGAVAQHVKGWQGTYEAGMHPVVGGHSRLRSGKKRRKPRTAAQKRATAKMLRAAKRSRKGGIRRRKKAGMKMAAHVGRKRRRTPAQIAATKKMIRAAKRARKGRKVTHHRRRTHKR